MFYTLHYNYLAMYFATLFSAAAWVAGWTEPFPFWSVVNLQAFHVEPFNITIDILDSYHSTTFYSFTITPGSIIFFILT